jgi:nucleoside-diphosphate-sugar epimerase
MRIALTGGTGFIGSHFLKQALAAKHSVLALRRSPSSKPRIPIDLQPQWLDLQLDNVTAEELQGCDVLVHLAAHSGNVPYDSLANCLHWNLMAVLSLFEQARQGGIKRFVMAGSCFEYGRSGERYATIPTDAPLEPTNTYAASKAAASITLSQWANEHQVSLDILRVFHVFGEGELESRFWPTLRRKALAGQDLMMTKGEQVRDFMNAHAVSKSFLERATMLHEAQGSTIFNLSSGNPCRIIDFAEYWWQHWEARGSLLFGALEYREGEVMNYQAGDDLIVVGDWKIQA